MEVRWLNARDDKGKLNAFRHREALYSELMEDGETFDQNWDYAPELSHSHIGYIASIYEGEIEGYFRLMKLGSILFEGHVVLAPELRGGQGIAFFREALALFRSGSPHGRLVGMTPMSNKPAMYFAYAIGFRPVGVVRNCFKKRGKLWGKMISELADG